MHRLQDSIRCSQALLALCGVVLAAPQAGQAQTRYQIQPIVRLGEHPAGLVIDDHFDVDALNDSGQITFLAGNADGDDTLVQYSGGKLTPLTVPGAAAPGGTWGINNGVLAPVSMNQLGNVVFATDVIGGGNSDLGTYFWDFKAQRITPVALPGMPVGSNLTLETGGEATPAINNKDEIALVARVKSAAGDTQPALFFLPPGGTLQPVVLPDQALPGGRPAVHAYQASINDAGAIGFLARRQGDGAHEDSAYIWEKGTITPVAVAGADAPGGGKFRTAWRALVNNANGNVVVAARLNDSKGPDALYLYTGAKLMPVMLPGQPLPGGGKFQTLQVDVDGLGVANGAGQHPFLAIRNDGSTAAYRMDADGTVSLILASGTVTPLGKITDVGIPTPSNEPRGVGISLNGKGQVALSVRINGGAPTLVLLTPTAP